MILNSAERMLTRRYLLPGKGEGFIFLVASISLLAVALGVAALIIVMSVMNGFRAELFDKIVGLNGHAIIQGVSGGLPDWQQLADTLGLYPGGEITLVNPEGRSTVVGTVPREVTYTVGAVVETGVYEYDKAYVVMPIQDAQQLLLMGDQVGMIEIQTNNPDKVQDILAP